MPASPMPNPRDDPDPIGYAVASADWWVRTGTRHQPEHQDYLQRYPNGYTCHFPRPGWKLPNRQPAA